VRNSKKVRVRIETSLKDADRDRLPEGGEAQIALTVYGKRRLIVRRTRLIGAQAELWPDWRQFALVTNRADDITIVGAEHRAHAVVEQVIADRKERALANSPSGHYGLDRARLPGPPPALMDATARPPRHDRSRRPHDAPPTAAVGRRPRRATAMSE